MPEGSPNKETPIFMGHGDSDPLVRPEWGQLTAKALRDMGCKVELRMYRWVSPLSPFFPFDKWRR